MKFKKILIYTCIATAIIIPGLYSIYGIITHSSLNLIHLVQGIFFSIALTVTIALWNWNYYKFLKKRFGIEKNQRNRIIAELIGSTIFAIIISYLVFIAFNYLFKFYNDGKSKVLSLFSNMVISAIVNLIVFSIVEALEWFNKWKQLTIESEQLKREKAESSYAALKNQVNPHFLFNSLNSLSSLIRISPEKAIEFVENFSQIYRYVLDVSDKMVVELTDEIKFLQSYSFLQKIRYGNNLNISINIDARKLHNFVLPLSLQFLIENAIKHNEISSEFPLNITIDTDGDFLVVKNNLQKKITTENSSGIGLMNITQRYKHISDLVPVFYIENNQYIAKIPLLIES